MAETILCVDDSQSHKKLKKKGKWSEKEVQLLSRAVQQHGCNWFEVAQHLPKRNPNQCAQKWKRLKGDRSRVNKFWTKVEDQRLVSLVSQYGQRWALICKLMENRDNRQCRDRYMNILNPALKSENFTEEEDYLIYLKYVELGSKWSLISKELDCRSEYQVKNRFHTHIRAHYLQIQSPYSTKLTIEQVKELLTIARENHLIELSKKINENQLDSSHNPLNQDSLSEYYEFSNQNILISNSSYTPEEEF